MKISFLLFLLVFGSSIVSAQDCDPDKIKTAPGTWITRADQNTGGLTAAEFAAERKLITSIHRVFGTIISRSVESSTTFHDSSISFARFLKENCLIKYKRNHHEKIITP